MTRPMLARRMATITRAQFNQVSSMLADGYGSSGILFETDVTPKQINAISEWIDRYGRIQPSDSDLMEVQS